MECVLSWLFLPDYCSPICSIFVSVSVSVSATKLWMGHKIASPPPQKKRKEDARGSTHNYHNLGLHSSLIWCPRHQDNFICQCLQELWQITAVITNSPLCKGFIRFRQENYSGLGQNNYFIKVRGTFVYLSLKVMEIQHMWSNKRPQQWLLRWNRKQIVNYVKSSVMLTNLPKYLLYLLYAHQYINIFRRQ